MKLCAPGIDVVLDGPPPPSPSSKGDRSVSFSMTTKPADLAKAHEVRISEHHWRATLDSARLNRADGRGPAGAACDICDGDSALLACVTLLHALTIPEEAMPTFAVHLWQSISSLMVQSVSDDVSMPLSALDLPDMRFTLRSWANACRVIAAQDRSTLGHADELDDAYALLEDASLFEAAQAQYQHVIDGVEHSSRLLSHLQRRARKGEERLRLAQRDLSLVGARGPERRRRMGELRRDGRDFRYPCREDEALSQYNATFRTSVKGDQSETVDSLSCTRRLRGACRLNASLATAEASVLALRRTDQFIRRLWVDLKREKHDVCMEWTKLLLACPPQSSRVWTNALQRKGMTEAEAQAYFDPRENMKEQVEPGGGAPII